jgi:hypothetical protein
VQRHLSDAHPLPLTLAPQGNPGILSTDQGGQRGRAVRPLYADTRGDWGWTFGSEQSGHGGTSCHATTAQPRFDR